MVVLLWPVGQILNKTKQKKTIMVRMTDGNKFTCRSTDMGCNTLGTYMTGCFPGRARLVNSRFTDNWRGSHINEQDLLLEIYTVTQWSRVWWHGREAEAAILQGQGGTTRPCLRQTDKHTATKVVHRIARLGKKIKWATMFWSDLCSFCFKFNHSTRKIREFS